MLKCQSTIYRLFIVLCWLWNIYEGAELPSVYFITNTKHYKTYLALSQLFPVLLTHRPHIVKYTYYVVFCCISSRSIAMGAFRGDKWIYQQHFFHSLQNNLGNISLISRYRCICRSVPTVCAFNSDTQTVENRSDHRIYLCVV